MAHYTVVGGRGFIGNEIVEQLRQLKQDVWVPQRDEETLFTKDLGTVIYCAGNGDCQNSPFSVFQANCALLADILQHSIFKRLVYMSSTRVYMNGINTQEGSDLVVSEDDARRLFNITKLVSEELCLKSGKDVVIVRPSNVYGVALNSPLFLPSITRNAINNGHIDMFIDRHYEKDYVSVEDVASACIKLSQNKDASGNIYNIAAGYNISAEQIANVLTQSTNCTVTWHERAFPREIFPVNDISTLLSVIPDYKPRHVLDDIESMVTRFRLEMENS
ncbi:TPA: SDR family oxidoreductase [Enterobacter asburiae]|jgi:nucleoside-diphosphate-sugar epimerase|uniref:NAD-dependent epimerase/dehydratase family protein n=1 Tax=Enterobacter asburiae TaxID=61645 RepID=UPI002DBD6F53|nr:SDR family oxidoreductase [Enterobacter asburiae]MEB7277165.1 SDR family oxidoreductase [Enterobacter asburiae]HDC4490156.1 SDR family oxidoreductase [Enterobacter asburiae]